MKKIFLLIFEFLILCEARRPAQNAAALYTNSKNVNIIADGKELSRSIKNSGKFKIL